MNYSTRKKAGGEIVESEGILSPPMHRQGSIETFTLVLPQCPRARKRAVTFRYSGKLIFNHCHLFQGRRPCESAKEILAPHRAYWYSPTQLILFAKGINRYFPCLSHMRRFPVSRLDCFQCRQAILRIRLPSCCSDALNTC